MTDLLDHAVRTSLAALLEKAPPHQEESPSGEPAVTATNGYRPRRSLVAVGVTATLLLLAGLVAISGRDHYDDQPAASTQADTRWLIDDLPDGWTIASVLGPGPIESVGAIPGPPQFDSLYATIDAPSGPILAIDSHSMPPDPTSEALPAETNFTEVTLNGRRASFADRDGGSRVLYLQVDRNWVRLQARKLTDDQLRTIAATLTVDANGLATLDPAELPPDLIHLPGNLDDIRYLTDGGTGSLYSDPSTAYGPLSMSVNRSPLAAAWLALDATSQRTVDINGLAGIVLYSVQSSPSVTVVAWQQNGLSFVIVGNDLDATVLINAARSAHAATPADWAQIPTYQAVETTQSKSTGPTGTTPPNPSD